jgi:hypothetical protein
MLSTFQTTLSPIRKPSRISSRPSKPVVTHLSFMDFPFKLSSRDLTAEPFSEQQNQRRTLASFYPGGVISLLNLAFGGLAA